MANRSNSGFRVPRLQLGEAVSGDVRQVNHSGDVGSGYAQIARVAEAFGGQLQEMADRAALGAGQDQATADIAAGRASRQTDQSIRGRAYNEVLKDQLGTRRRATLREGMGQAFVDHGANPAELEAAFSAIRQAQPPSGFADLDVAIDGDYQLLRADYMGKSAAQVRKAQVEQGQAAFLETVTHSQATLDQVAGGASFDPAGHARVTAAYGVFVKDLVKYGPREAFTLDGVEYAADPARLGALSTDDLAKTTLGARQQAQLTWILGAGGAIEGSQAKADFAADVRRRWKSGDAMFAGLHGQAMDTTLRRLEGDADRAEVDERAERAEAARSAGNMLEALQYGADVDLDAMIATAKASGDAGLLAKAELYAQSERENPGVWRQRAQAEVDGPEDVDAWFRGGPGGRQPRGIRNRNPGNVKALGGGRKWPGQIGVDADGFAVFGSMSAGDAAARANLQSYGRRGFDTVSEIIGRWAPPSENDTGAYVTAVSRRLGVGPNDKLDLNDPKILDGLLDAIYRHENGPGWRSMAAGAPEAFQNDPIGYARGTADRPPLATVPALALDDAFSDDGQAVAGWAATIRRRQALGGVLGQTAGREGRMLDNSERAYYKGVVDEDPVKAVRLAVTARQALGEEGAARLMREIGGKSDNTSTALHLADLAAGGSPIFATQAAEGLALKGGGRSLSPEDARALKVSMEELGGPALRQVPAAYAPALRTAEAAMIRDQAKGIDREPSYYVQSALGGASVGGEGYGGVVTLNGARTVLPRWLHDEYGDDALRALADYWAPRGLGPVYSNGKPMPAEKVGRMQLVLLPNGWYRLVNPETGKPVMRGDGKAFDIEIDATRGFLRGRLGARAVRGGQ